MTPGVDFTYSAASFAAGDAVANRPAHLFTTPVEPARAALGFSKMLSRGYAIVT